MEWLEQCFSWCELKSGVLDAEVESLLVVLPQKAFLLPVPSRVAVLLVFFLAAELWAREQRVTELLLIDDGGVG